MLVFAPYGEAIVEGGIHTAEGSPAFGQCHGADIEFRRWERTVVGDIECIAKTFFQFDIVGVGLIVADSVSTVVCMAELYRLEPLRQFREELKQAVVGDFPVGQRLPHLWNRVEADGMSIAA